MNQQNQSKQKNKAKTKPSTKKPSTLAILFLVGMTVVTYHIYFNSASTLENETQQATRWGNTAKSFLIANPSQHSPAHPENTTVPNTNTLTTTHTENKKPESNATSSQPLLMVMGTRQKAKPSDDYFPVVASFYDAFTGTLIKETTLGQTKDFNLNASAKNIAGDVYVILEDFTQDTHNETVPYALYKVSKDYLTVHALPLTEVEGLSLKATTPVHMHFPSGFAHNHYTRSAMPHSDSEKHEQIHPIPNAIQFSVESKQQPTQAIFYFPKLKHSYSLNASLKEIYPLRPPKQTRQHHASASDTGWHSTVGYVFAQTDTSSKLVRYEQEMRRDMPRAKPLFLSDILSSANYYAENDGLQDLRFVSDRLFSRSANVLYSDDEMILVIDYVDATDAYRDDAEPDIDINKKMDFTIEKLSAKTGETLWKVPLQGWRLPTNSDAIKSQQHLFIRLLGKQVVIHDAGDSAKLVKVFDY